MSELMTYKMLPAGHEEPAPKRKYEKPDSRLAKAFEEWLRIPVGWSWGQAYASAESMLNNLEFKSEDVNSLALAYQDHPKFRDAGLFFTVMFNNCKDKEMVFNPGKELPIEWLGYRLHPEKTLVNLAPICGLGENYSGGTLLNYEKITNRLGGGGNHGLTVNYGTSQQIDGGCLGTVHINFGTVLYTPGHTNQNSLFINFGTWGTRKHVDLEYHLSETTYFGLVPALDKYVENLQRLFEPGKTDYKKAIEAARSLGPKPAEKILTEVAGLLKGAGHNVY